MVAELVVNPEANARKKNVFWQYVDQGNEKTNISR